MSFPASPFDVGKASRSAALGLLTYDYLITFDAEVNFVWRQRKCTWSFWLYIFNKFLPVAWISFASIALNSGTILTQVSFTSLILLPSNAPQMCIFNFTASEVVPLLVTFGVQLILQMRVYALYELNKRLRYLLLIGCTAELVAMLAFIPRSVIRIIHIHWIQAPTGCYYSSDIGITRFWIPALVFEPVLCALVAWKAWGVVAARWMRLPRSRVCDVVGGSLDLDDVPPLVTLMARDSLVYFLGVYSVLVALTIASMARFDSFIVVMLPYVSWMYVLPSILGSRVVLHMRELMLAGNTPSLPPIRGVETLVFATASAAGAQQDDGDVYHRSSSRADEERGSVASVNG
ncbi:hypothetical protein FA95DRAFT_1613505 [Auriscalpium vulgare]|uniref:Uncharacterized protein n=1 Tax=Auriscalpium vulgare TaxID=40419 RepID=A0ACB8R2E0_9AGAM|nr:hypothetical protein FA95DRAFT_1613505 [Auriscalpium vulgare]